MSEVSGFWNDNKKWLKPVLWGATVFTLGISSFKTISSSHFGVHTRFGKILNDTIGPGVEPKIPFVDKVYELQNNTIILETTAGTGRNTKDQNMLSSEMRLHYTINPKAGVLGLHLKKLGNDNGKEFLENLMDQSYDAVVGERNASDHMADPKALLASFAENLEWREKQNNFPIDVDAIELLTSTVGDGATPYRTPVQLRIRRINKDGTQGWAIEQMAGPAALPVESGGHLVKPSDKQPIKDTVKIKDSLKLQ